MLRLPTATFGWLSYGLYKVEKFSYNSQNPNQTKIYMKYRWLKRILIVFLFLFSPVLAIIAALAFWLGLTTGLVGMWSKV